MKVEVNGEEGEGEESSKRRLIMGDELDSRILKTAIPSMINLAVVPLVNAVDTFWVGRLGSALALAGQAAANQTFFTLYFLIAFIPTITAPLVASAVAAKDTESAQSRVCEAVFLSNIFGALGTIIMTGFPYLALKLVLSPDAPAMEYAAPYLRLRALSLVPTLFSSTGFAAYRGLLNTVTPLKVSLTTNTVNLITDPLCIFVGKLGAAGAAIATAGSEFLSGLIYLKLLLRRKLINWKRLVTPPSFKSLLPLLKSGLAMLARQFVLNTAFLVAARRSQAMDPTGVSAAAYGITMQIYSLGVVVHLAIQSTAATLVPSAMASDSISSARSVADRIFIWGSIIGLMLSIGSLTLTPLLVPFFSPLPEVREAIKMPALISSFIHLVNGLVFAGEGCMLGFGAYRALALITAIGVAIMVGCISIPFIGGRLDGILLSLAAFNTFQGLAVLFYHLRIGPLRRNNIDFSWLKLRRKQA
eukprot:CAMPEP_0178968670 /NCGR_PEP_ID=MMETSP0789-20121207/18397_1 /TAXON_ID=3005 /ORGANISM="Rhizosolenia setigera, Strain CCMP 1694" /LENGTH=472 /DNA_ID=CAMNT_0020654653 /DNA_START=271 /DNA_END=1689 /DNA_ORIENTATION=+